MTKPTFSILKDTEDNTNLAIQQLIEISLEDGTLTKEDLVKMDSEKRMLVTEEEYIYNYGKF